MNTQKTHLIVLVGICILLLAGVGLSIVAGQSGKVVSSVEPINRDATFEQIKAVPGTPDGVLMMQAQALFGKLPATMPGSEQDTPARIALGRKLYFEEAISINKTQSCNSCHPIDNKGAGADHRKTGLGALGKFGPRNDPPVLNAGYQIAQFWDGRSPTLKDQAKGPVLNPIEMGMPNGEAVAERLKGIPGYPAEFKKAFPDEKDPVTFDNFAEAVAAFERTLISRGRFDRFMDGDKQALTGREIEGMRSFINVGCVQCHSGPNLGGMTFQKIGTTAFLVAMKVFGATPQPMSSPGSATLGFGAGNEWRAEGPHQMPCAALSLVGAGFQPAIRPILTTQGCEPYALFSARGPRWRAVVRRLTPGT